MPCFAGVDCASRRDGRVLRAVVRRAEATWFEPRLGRQADAGSRPVTSRRSPRRTRPSRPRTPATPERAATRAQPARALRRPRPARPARALLRPSTVRAQERPPAQRRTTAHHVAARGTHGQGRRTGHAASAASRLSAVQRAMHAHKVVALLFYNPAAADDRAVKQELAAVPDAPRPGRQARDPAERDRQATRPSPSRCRSTSRRRSC